MAKFQSRGNIGHLGYKKDIENNEYMSNQGYNIMVM